MSNDQKCSDCDKELSIPEKECNVRKFCHDCYTKPCQPVARRLLEMCSEIKEWIDQGSLCNDDPLYERFCRTIKFAEQKLAEPPTLEFEIRSTPAMDAVSPDWTHLNVQIAGYWFTQVFRKDDVEQKAHAIAESLGMKANVILKRTK